MRKLRAGFVIASVLAGIVACASGPKPKEVAPREAAIALDAHTDAGAIVVTRCNAPSAAADPAPTAAPTSPSGDDDPDYASMLRKKTAQTKDACELADDNIARAAKEILSDVGRAAPASEPRWDKRAPLAHMAKVDARFVLTPREKAMLAENGFVVLPRQTSSSYAWALHEIYESEVPLYVSMDAILFAIYSSNDKLIAHVETSQLVGKLDQALARMHCALAEHWSEYPKDVARDVDLYLTVARSLLAGAPVASVLGSDDEANALASAATKAEGFATVDIFGRARFVDWSQYVPRGHYGNAPKDFESQEPQPSGLENYFRASMWLSRMELNVVSRSSRSSEPGDVPNREETPREAADALALADLAQTSGAIGDLAVIDRTWTLFAGKREDLSIADLISLRKKAGIEKIDTSSQAPLAHAIGDGFQRTARFHRMPEGSTTLPVIATLLGPRVTADSQAFLPLVHSRVIDRHMLHAGDVGAAMGLDSARRYLKADITSYPSLPGALDAARAIVKNADDDQSLYYAWFSAVRGLAAPPRESAPSFMKTFAWQDKSLDSIVAGYGEMRHNYVLMVGQAYDEGGCEIPDAWVEPRPETLDALVSYAARGKNAMRELDPKDESGARAYFTTLESTLVVLRKIVADEIEGRPLSNAEKRWLSMVAEMTPGSTGSAPTYTGWYFDMFRTRQAEALSRSDFIADFYTSAKLGQVAYAGGRAPAFGVFVIDSGGPPRVMVGPVSRAYEAWSSVNARLSDETADKADAITSEWDRSYTAPIPEAPAIAVSAILSTFEDGGRPHAVVARVHAQKPIMVKIDLLDHHRRVIESLTKTVQPGKRAEYKFRARRGAGAVGIRASSGDWLTEAFGTEMEPSVAFGLGGLDPVVDDLKE